MTTDTDALVIGAGPAGSGIAILLAQAGWRVTLVEQHGYPRQKVCGECISAGSLTLLDELGIGPRFRERAGPELRRVGWLGEGLLSTAFPPCAGAYAYGRALGRDVLDELLVDRARALGVRVLQPAKVCEVWGAPGDLFTCEIRTQHRGPRPPTGAAERIRQRARLVIDAHGSWEAGPGTAAAGGAHGLGAADNASSSRPPPRAADLFAFKATFRNSALPAQTLPVIAFRGGYGGVVVANEGRTTLACCIRRDALRRIRAAAPGVAAGQAVQDHLLRSCRGLAAIIDVGQREHAWLSVGPIRPGVRVAEGAPLFRVGNAAGESHPLIGEGISMALQGAFLLARHLVMQPPALDPAAADAVRRRYAAAWRAQFTPRLRFARAYAHAAMRPALSVPLHALLRGCPALLGHAARWAGKAHRAPRRGGLPVGGIP